jgi:hypothetical protein
LCNNVVEKGVIKDEKKRERIYVYKYRDNTGGGRDNRGEGIKRDHSWALTD